jgi:predicted amidophosphoribosyltransferase
MFCPNCGANNNRKQNYCRFCGLNLQDAAKSLTNQIVFGEDSKSLKKLSSIKRVVDFTSTTLIGMLLVGIAAYLFFFDPKFGKDLIKISLGVFFLLKTIQEVIGYFQRRARSRNKRFEPKAAEQFGPQETAKLLEEKTFEPVPSVIENSTALLPLENETRKL